MLIVGGRGALGGDRRHRLLRRQAELEDDPHDGPPVADPGAADTALAGSINLRRRICRPAGPNPARRPWRCPPPRPRHEQAGRVLPRASRTYAWCRAVRQRHGARSPASVNPPCSRRGGPCRWRRGPRYTGRRRPGPGDRLRQRQVRSVASAVPVALASATVAGATVSVQQVTLSTPAGVRSFGFVTTFPLRHAAWWASAYISGAGS